MAAQEERLRGGVRTLSIIIAHCVPLPAAGAPAIMTLTGPAQTLCTQERGTRLKETQEISGLQGGCGMRLSPHHASHARWPCLDARTTCIGMSRQVW